MGTWDENRRRHGVCQVCAYYGEPHEEVPVRSVEATRTPKGKVRASLDVCVMHYSRFRRLGSPWLVRNKLTDKQIARIRRRAAAGEPQHKLAREFGVSATTLSVVLRLDPKYGRLGEPREPA